MLFFLLWACLEPEQQPKVVPLKEPYPQEAAKEEPTSSIKTGPVRVFVLKDGSTVTGEFLETTPKGFHVRSTSLGEIHIPSSSVISMTPVREPSSQKKEISTRQPTVQKDSVPTLNNTNLEAVPVLRGANSINNIASPKANNAKENTMRVPRANQLVISQIKDQLLQDPDTLSSLYTLQQDPEIMALISDPQFLALIQSGDLEAIQKHPKIKALESNRNIQSIIKQLNIK